MPRLGLILTIGALSLLTALIGEAWADVVANGVRFNGISHNGISHNGISHNGVRYNGVKVNGISHNNLGRATIPGIAIVAVILPAAPAR